MRLGSYTNSGLGSVRAYGGGWRMSVGAYGICTASTPLYQVEVLGSKGRRTVILNTKNVSANCVGLGMMVSMPCVCVTWSVAKSRRAPSWRAPSWQARVRDSTLMPSARERETERDSGLETALERPRRARQTALLETRRDSPRQTALLETTLTRPLLRDNTSIHHLFFISTR